MSTFFNQALISAAKAVLKKKKVKHPISAVQLEQEVQRLQTEITFSVRNIFFLCMGMLSATFGIKGLLLPNGLIFGGVMGASLLLEAISHASLAMFLIAANLPFIIIGFWTISPGFALKSLIAILLLAVCVHFIDVPLISEDKLLAAVFGGIFLGLGLGLVIRSGAIVDGMEVLAIFASRRSRISIGGIVLVFNLIVFSLGAYLLSVEIAFYSILAYLVSSRAVDFVIDGMEEYIGVTIVTHYSEEVRLAIIEKLGRGCTIYTGKRGFAARGEPLVSTDIIFTVITRLELSKLQKEVNKIDRKAFVVMGAIKDTQGGMVKKRPLVG